MVTSSAAQPRIFQHEKTKTVPQIDSGTALRIAHSWMDAMSAEQALSKMGCGILAWRAAPPAQNVMASIVSDQLSPNDRIMCVGFQPYGWMAAAGMDTKDILRVYMGKKMPANAMSFTAEDAAVQMAVPKKGMTVVALHVENAADWNDVRAISAAAVKAEASMLMLVSAAADAPEGAAVDRVQNWNEAVDALREAADMVRTKGAIRVVAMNDNAMPDIERAMMDAAGMFPENWQMACQKNNDGAEVAANAAYQSPVESF